MGNISSGGILLVGVWKAVGRMAYAWLLDLSGSKDNKIQAGEQAAEEPKRAEQKNEHKRARAPPRMSRRGAAPPEIVKKGQQRKAAPFIRSKYYLRNRLA
ncbi:hypothetical protein D918_04271 [Trichuris suis]|nr:hypothetical protein D918_04271 [Trichuris suis]